VPEADACACPLGVDDGPPEPLSRNLTAARTRSAPRAARRLSQWRVLVLKCEATPSGRRRLRPSRRQARHAAAPSAWKEAPKWVRSPS
jgi:hypothetical protein